jgi:hypothetical protein
MIPPTVTASPESRRVDVIDGCDGRGDDAGERDCEQGRE